jgi:hypothetical protein
MARGFESKQIEAQQEEATRGRDASHPKISPAERATRERQQTLRLTRARAEADLSRATVPAHRRMLEQAIEALNAQLQELTTST